VLNLPPPLLPASLPNTQDEFQAQLSALRAEEDAARSAEAELTAQLEVARREGAALAAVAEDVAALEERYWHGLNDYAAMVWAHVNERWARRARSRRGSIEQGAEGRQACCPPRPSRTAL
jgi:hypothetical protein